MLVKLCYFAVLVEASKRFAESLLEDHWGSETGSLKRYKLHSVHHRTSAAFSVKLVVREIVS